MSRAESTQYVAAASRRVERVYGVLARVYDGFFDWALGPGRRYAVSQLKPRPGERILEVGVGTGLSLPLYPSLEDDDVGNVAAAVCRFPARRGAGVSH